MLMLKKGREPPTTYIAVLINSRREYGPPVGAKPFRIVRSSPKKGNPERCSGYYHRLLVPKQLAFQGDFSHLNDIFPLN